MYTAPVPQLPTHMPTSHASSVVTKRYNGEPYIYARTPRVLGEWVGEFYKAADRGRIGYDVETTGLEPSKDKLVLIQLKIESLPCLIVDCRFIPPQYIHSALAPILENTAHSKIGHNLQFDYAFTLYHLGISMRRLYDTMIAEKLLTAGLNADCRLTTVTQRRLGYPLDKSLQTSFIESGQGTEPFTHEQLLYAAADTDVLFPIMRQQVNELRAEKMVDVAALEFDVVPVLAEASLNGVMIDEERWRAHIQMLDRERAAIEVGLIEELTPAVLEYRKARYGEAHLYYSRLLADYEALHSMREAQAAEEKARLLEMGLSKGDAHRALNAWKKDNPPPKKPQKPSCGEGPINLGSPEQLQGALDVLGVDLPRKRETGALETDRKHLQMVAGAWPICERILQWREYQKLVTSFGENILAMLDANSRIHPDFNQLVSTGRMSASRPNVQQIPGADKELGKEFRRSFVAPDGRMIVAADYSQIELRILAEVTGDANLQGAFNSGVDLHAQTAALMFGLPVDEVKDKYPDKRKAAKSINFGIMYGLGPGGLAQQLSISRTQAKEYIDMYFAAYPGVFAWKKRTQEQGMVDFFATTSLGRRRYFTPIKRPERIYRNSPQWQNHEMRNMSEGQEAEYNKFKAAYERMMCNHVIQGGSADITKGAAVLIYSALQTSGLDAFLAMFVHDEIVLEVGAECADAVAALVVEKMREAGERFIRSVPVEVGCQIDTYWSH